MPVLKFDSQEAVPEDIRDEATQITAEGEDKGKWQVNVVGRKKLESFRDNNTKIAAEKEAKEKALRTLAGILGVNPDEIDAEKITADITGLRETARKVADGKLKASDDLDKVVAERTEAMRAKFDENLQEKSKELGRMKEERDTAVAAFRRTFIDRAVAGVIGDPDLGLENTALADVMNRAYSVFKVQEDNSLVPQKNGQTIWGEDGTTPMSVKEWIDLVLRKEAPHYFKKSNGGGATGGADTGQFGGMSEEAFSKLSARQRLEIANKASMAKSAKR